MNVLIDARSPFEYLRLRRAAELLNGVSVFRAPFLWRGRPKRHYDVIVFARGDARNLALAERWQDSWGETFVILVMDSAERTLDAARCHIYDYLIRPLDEERFTRALCDAAAYFAKRTRGKTS